MIRIRAAAIIGPIISEEDGADADLENIEDGEKHGRLPSDQTTAP